MTKPRHRPDRGGQGRPGDLPSHDDYAERALLGLVLAGGRTAAAEALDTCPVDDIYLPKHQITYAAIARLHTEGDDVGPVTVLDTLRRAGDLDRAGGGHYLFALMDAVTPGVSVARTAEIVAAHAHRRRATDGLTHARQLVRDADLERLSDILARARTALDDIAAPAPASRWHRRDLTAALAGLTSSTRPAIGARTDGAALFYPGRLHSIAAEPEAGKTWLALHACAAELTAGHQVLYIDFEDDETGIVTRLRALGAAPATIRDNFAYVRPDTALTSGSNRDVLAALLDTTRPRLAVIDGVTEAMALHGLDLLDNTDIARFTAILPRFIADRGPGVVCLDHVTKDRDGGGGRRYSIGGQHKLASIDGAAYVLDNRTPFGTDTTGRSTILIAKDRPGQLRYRAWRHSSGLAWYGDLALESVRLPGGATALNAQVTPPAAAADDTDRPFRPTVLMTRVCAALTRAGEPLTVRGILDRVRGNSAQVRAAIAALVDDGYVEVRNGPNRAQLHALIAPFEGASQ